MRSLRHDLQRPVARGQERDVRPERHPVEVAHDHERKRPVVPVADQAKPPGARSGELRDRHREHLHVRLRLVGGARDVQRLVAEQQAADALSGAQVHA